MMGTAGVREVGGHLLEKLTSSHSLPPVSVFSSVPTFPSSCCDCDWSLRTKGEMPSVWTTSRTLNLRPHPALPLGILQEFSLLLRFPMGFCDWTVLSHFSGQSLLSFADFSSRSPCGGWALSSLIPPRCPRYYSSTPAPACSASRFSSRAQLYNQPHPTLSSSVHWISPWTPRSSCQNQNTFLTPTLLPISLMDSRNHACHLLTFVLTSK